MSTDIFEEPIMTFPDQERDFLKQNYENARVILEYGSGGSTLFAARLPGRYVMSVESDRRWATGLQKLIDTEKPVSHAVIHYSDIGPIGDWGRPTGETHWRKFHRYPAHIWAQDFFRPPDLVLIDGRMRAACFVATFLRIRKPTTVLFDDYVNREAYHIVEKLAAPVETSGRMARFVLQPGERPQWIHDLFMELIGDVTFATTKNFPYPAHEDTGYPFSRSMDASDSKALGWHGNAMIKADPRI